jgi:hypothetical protein
MNYSSPKRPLDTIAASHRNMYKSPCRGALASNTSDNKLSPWRDNYKKKCFDEFKKSRQKLLTKFRNFQITDCRSNENINTLKDYLNSELEKICFEEATKDLISIDDAIDIYKQIQYELSIEDMNQIMDENISLKDDIFEIKVICPLCQKCELEETQFTIECKQCSFKLNTIQSNIRLKDLSYLLENAVAQHTCNEVPYFQTSGSNIDEFILLMSCDKCNFMKFIL